MVHLELFHHFATVTGPAISVGEMSEEMWSTIIPRIALSHDFLMYALLAISSTHIAHLNPTVRNFYWEQATTLEGQALRLAHDQMVRVSSSPLPKQRAPPRDSNAETLTIEPSPDRPRRIQRRRAFRLLNPHHMVQLRQPRHAPHRRLPETPPEHNPMHQPPPRHPHHRSLSQTIHLPRRPRPFTIPQPRKLQTRPAIQLARNQRLLLRAPRLLLHHVRGQHRSRGPREFRRRRDVAQDVVFEGGECAQGRDEFAAGLALGDSVAGGVCGEVGGGACHSAGVGGALVCAFGEGEALLVDGWVGGEDDGRDRGGDEGGASVLAQVAVGEDWGPGGGVRRCRCYISGFSYLLIHEAQIPSIVHYLLQQYQIHSH